MIKSLIGTMGLFAIMVWVAICGAGYTLNFFGLIDFSGWFSEEWLTLHPIFDLSLLALVLLGTYSVMSSAFDLMGLIKDEPEKKGSPRKPS